MGSPDTGRDWPTFENQVLRTAALDLKLLAIALHGESPESEASEPFELTDEGLSYALHALARRTEAPAALARKLRRARYGNPQFGGEDRAVMGEMTAVEEEDEGE